MIFQADSFMHGNFYFEGGPPYCLCSGQSTLGTTEIKTKQKCSALQNNQSQSWLITTHAAKWPSLINKFNWFIQILKYYSLIKSRKITFIMSRTETCQYDTLQLKILELFESEDFKMLKNNQMNILLNFIIGNMKIMEKENRLIELID